MLSVETPTYLAARLALRRLLRLLRWLGTRLRARAESEPAFTVWYRTGPMREVEVEALEAGLAALRGRYGGLWSAGREGGSWTGGVYIRRGPGAQADQGRAQRWLETRAEVLEVHAGRGRLLPRHVAPAT